MDNSKNSLQNIIKNVQTQNYTEAEQLCILELKSNPNNQPILTLLGTIYYNNREFIKSIEYFEKALKLKYSENIIKLLGNAYYYIGNYEKAYPFLNILEEQVSKMGTEISEVIKKEHFDIAVRKVSVGNSILSIKNINRINMIEIFEKINGVEDILKKDPVNVYDKMDYKTKIYYRNKLKEISKKTKISEIYIARKCLELSNKEYEKARLDMKNKKAHIGYYLISEGEQTLLGILQNKKIVRQTYMKKAKNYILTLTIITIIVSAFFGSYINAQIKKILFK